MTAEDGLSDDIRRFRVADETGYMIFDQYSIAGMWVNYEPVPRMVFSKSLDGLSDLERE